MSEDERPWRVVAPSATPIPARLRGLALPLVLACTLLIGLAGLSLAFVTTLDALAARSAQDAARAAGQAEAGLAVAAASLAGASGRGGAGVRTLGPWPAQGVSASVQVSWLEAEVVELSSGAVVGRSQARRRLVLDISGGAPVVLSRR